MHATYPAHLIILYLITALLSEEYKLRILFLCNFHDLPSTFPTRIHIFSAHQNDTEFSHTVPVYGFPLIFN
jgi:hypothetical protein